MSEPAIPGPVQVIRQIADDWCLSMDEVANLLAYPDRQSAVDLLRGLIALRNVDREDRVRLIFRIYCVLAELFPSAQQRIDWLRGPSELFAGKSPLQEMMQERIPGMVLVRDTINRLAGR